jgi:hypothetical protein
MQLPTNVVKVDFDGLEALVKANPANEDIYSLSGELPGRLRYLHPRCAQDETHYVALSGDLIVGVGSTRAYPDSRIMVLAQVSVDQNFPKQGHARRILESIFNDIADTGLVLGPSNFTKMGWDYLAKTIPILHARRPELAISWDEDRPNVHTYGYHPYTLVYENFRREVRHEQPTAGQS